MPHAFLTNHGERTPMNDELINSMPFAASMGIKISQASADEVLGSMLVREDLCTLGSSVHGGALMAFADAMGGIAAFLNLPEGAAGTTTIESKTNFMRPAKAGTELRARTVPVNVGKRLCVLTTTIEAEAGKPVAVVTQTQMVL